MNRTQARTPDQAPPRPAASDDRTGRDGALRIAPRRAGVLAPVLLTVVLGACYWTTLHPGVEDADGAELQLMAPLLGVCHPPGYPFVTLGARLFTVLLPLGDLAWRVNLMTACCAVATCLLVCRMVQQATGRDLAGLVAGASLGFSGIYWSHALVAEVYAFYSLFLVAGFYGVLQFCRGAPVGWLYTGALALGVCVGNRPSEVFALPALLALWWSHRSTARLSRVRLLTCIALGVAPFVFTLVFFVVRESGDALYSRDDRARDALLRGDPKLLVAHGEVIVDERPFAELTTAQKIGYAISYSLGLKWAGRAEFTWKDLTWDLDKLAWHLGGMGLVTDRYAPDDKGIWRERLEQGRGGSIGAPGLLLAALGLIFARRSPGLALFAAILTAGNLFFYLFHSPPDNLEFISPALIGLSLLAGIGAAGWAPDRRGAALLAVRIAALLAPLALAVGNFEKVDRSTTQEAQRQNYLAAVRQADFPPDTVLLAKYDEAMTLRYLFYVASQRQDIRVLIFRSRYETRQGRALIKGLSESGKPFFVHGRVLEEAERTALTRRTPRELLDLGFYRLSD